MSFHVWLWLLICIALLIFSSCLVYGEEEASCLRSSSSRATGQNLSAWSFCWPPSHLCGSLGTPWSFLLLKISRMTLGLHSGSNFLQKSRFWPPFSTLCALCVIAKVEFNTKVIKMARCRFVFEKTIGAILVDFPMVNCTQLSITLSYLWLK